MTREKTDELEKLLKEWIKIEEDVIGKLSEKEKLSKNVVANLLLHELIIDSMSHINMLQTIIEVIHGKVDSKETIGVSLEEIRNHINMEEKALEFANEALEKIDNKVVKLLLQHIADDEKRHHQILEELAKNFLKVTA